MSDSEDEDENEPWHLKDAAARSLSRQVMLRTEGGAALRVPASGAECRSRSAARHPPSLRSVIGRSRSGARGALGPGAGDDASGSDSDTGRADEMQPPHAEGFTPRPIDQGRKEFYMQNARGLSGEEERGGRARGGGGHGGGAAAEQEEEDAVARAAAAGDIPDVEVEENGGDGGGRRAAHTPVKGVGSGKDAAAAKGKMGAGKGEVKDMVQACNKGKSSSRALQVSSRRTMSLKQMRKRLLTCTQLRCRMAGRRCSSLSSTIAAWQTTFRRWARVFVGAVESGLAIPSSSSTRPQLTWGSWRFRGLGSGARCCCSC